MRVTTTSTPHVRGFTVCVLTGVILVLGAAQPAAAEAACRNQSLAMAPGRTAKVERATECLVNEVRRANGLRRLSVRGSLRRTSGRYAASLVRGRYFSHTSRAGAGPARRMRRYRAGRSSYRVAENLGYAPRRASAARIVGRWLRSPGHRRVMLDPGFRHIGVGVARRTPRGHRTGGTFVLHVGRRG